MNLSARLALFRTVCDAVAHAHRHLVIHCDIKPANVLVNAEGRAMLLDCGISRMQGQGDEAALAMTPAYTSPEQMAGQVPGIASDVFSLGRLLAEFLAHVAANHTRGFELAGVVARATAHDPEQRYGSVGELQEDLHRPLAHQPVAALAGRRVYVMRKGLRRHWQWLLASALLVLLSAGFTLRLMAELTRAQAALAQAQADERADLRRGAVLPPSTTAPPPTRP